MANTNLNSSYKMHTSTVPEQGWITGHGRIAKGHNPGSEEKYRDGQVAVYDIKPYDLLFTYSDEQRLQYDRHGMSHSGDDKPIFACINNMQIKQKVSFVGVATTGCFASSNSSEPVSYTMSGTVTIDNYSNVGVFQPGDKVAYKLPDQKGPLPYSKYDDDVGRIRPVLYPVRKKAPYQNGLNSNLLNYQDCMKKAAKKAENVRGNPVKMIALLKRMYKNSKSVDHFESFNADCKKDAKSTINRMFKAYWEDASEMLNHYLEKDPTSAMQVYFFTKLCMHAVVKDLGAVEYLDAMNRIGTVESSFSEAVRLHYEDEIFGTIIGTVINVSNNTDTIDIIIGKK